MTSLPRKLTLVAVTLLFWGWATGATATEEPPPAPGLGYNYYQYNYPHHLPADYVYRTGRVFSPLELEHAAALAASGEKGVERRSDIPAPADPLSDEVLQGLVAELLGAGREGLHDGYRLAVSTPVSLHNLYATSSLGRLLGERLLGELQRTGVEVIDVRKTPALMIHERYGEYGLSRDMDELSFVLDAQAVLVGTYTATPERLLLDLRVLRNQDNLVLASARRNFDMTRELSALLADEAAPRPTARVPVRGYPQTQLRPRPLEE